MKNKTFVTRNENKTESYLKNHIRVGDKIIIKDGSYMVDAELNHVYGIDFINSKGEYELLEVFKVNVPVYTDISTPNGVLSVQNNCIVKGSDGKIYYCSRINLEVFTAE